MIHNIISSLPLVHVSSASAAEAFYCRDLGFTKEWEYRPDAPSIDPCFMSVAREGATLRISSFSGDGVSGGVVEFIVRDVDALYEEFRSRRVPVTLPPVNQTWGNREMYIRDPDGNSLRFIQHGP